MFWNGTNIAKKICENLTKEQIQANGIDLTVNSIFEFANAGFLGVNEKKLPQYTEIIAVESVYYLSQGSYLIQYNERVKIPLKAVGIVLPRSSLMRMGCELHTALWDQGYKGEGIGLLIVHSNFKVQINARIGQLIIANAEESKLYSGAYQNEKGSNRQ